MASKWYNTCGVPYRFHAGGGVEVQGYGMPKYDTEGAVAAKLAKIWERWGRAITRAARKHDLPPAWLVGVMYIESGGNPNAVAPCEPKWCPGIWNYGGCAAQGGPNQYCAGGLMAFTNSTASSFFGKNIDYYVAHPEEQIMDSAHLISTGGPPGTAYGGGVKGRDGDILSVVKMYNGGSVCGGGGLTGHGGQADYVSKFIKSVNTFLELGLAPVVSPAAGVLMLGLFAAVGWLSYDMLDNQHKLTPKIVRHIKELTE